MVNNFQYFHIMFFASVLETDCDEFQGSHDWDDLPTSADFIISEVQRIIGSGDDMRAEALMQALESPAAQVLAYIHIHVAFMLVMMALIY